MKTVNSLLAPFAERKPTKIIVCDIDGTIVVDGGNNSSIRSFREMIENRDAKTLFVYATGRNPEKIATVINQYQLPKADIHIASVGSAIVYDLSENRIDPTWDAHIRTAWNRQALFEKLSTVAGLTLQPAVDQSETKLSYFTDPVSFVFENVTAVLGDMSKEITLLYSQNLYLDILPAAASKSKAIHFIANSLSIAPSNIIACGDSENDLDMLNDVFSGLVVKNHTPGLEVLRTQKNVYFADHDAAEGVIEGLRKKKFI